MVVMAAMLLPETTGMDLGQAGGGEEQGVAPLAQPAGTVA